MEKVMGLRGIFFEADDPRALAAWYHEHLGWATDPEGDRFELWEPR